jgi:hypothetical protein
MAVKHLQILSGTQKLHADESCLHIVSNEQGGFRRELVSICLPMLEPSDITHLGRERISGIFSQSSPSAYVP